MTDNEHTATLRVKVFADDLLIAQFEDERLVGVVLNAAYCTPASRNGQEQKSSTLTDQDKRQILYRIVDIIKTDLQPKRKAEGVAFDILSAVLERFELRKRP